jgi:cyclin B
MRKNVIDWLIQKHHEQKLNSETLYLSINILDRFLSKTDFEVTTQSEFELIGLTSLLLASKYEQKSAVGVYDIEYMADYSFTPDEICEMEKLILKKLNWILSVPTPYVFLVRNIGSCPLSDEDRIIENLASFFSELSLTQYSIVCDYKPSMIAAAAMYCARVLVGRYPFWNADLMISARYPEQMLWPCVKVMMELCNETCKDGTMEVFKKFSSLYRSRVSCIAQEILEQTFLS